MLTIDTNHMGGNLVHIQKQTMVEEQPPQSTCVSKSPEQTKSRNMASPEITAHVFLSFPNRMAQTISFSNQNFWFYHVN